MIRLAWPEERGDFPWGGKGRSLRDLVRAGFPVPAWCALTLEQPPDDGDWDAAAKIAWNAGLRETLERLCPDGRAIAVRSSAADEDGAAHSFAGQFDSFLGIDPRDPAAVATAVAGVWRSGFSERVLAYRRERGLAERPRPPTVLLQRLVIADAAGVAFSADPVGGRRDVAVVSAVPGLGSALVDGVSDADTWRVDRAGRLLERTLAQKRLARRLAAQGVHDAPLDLDEAARPALDDDRVREVAALARRVARHAGRAQDIEWAVEGGSVFLLQARPITSLGAVADPSGRLLIWDNSNIAESYSGVTTPLTFTFARRAYEEVYRAFCRIMGVQPAVVADHADTFANMIGIVRGRVFYNLISWYRVLAMLPGFTVNRKFMEQMMGVKEGMPDEVLAGLTATGAGARFRDALAFACTLAGLVRQHVGLPRQIRRFYARLDAALAPPVPPLEDMRLDELTAHYRELERQLLTRWDAPLVNDFFAMVFFGLLRSLAAKWCGADAALQNDLVAGAGDIVSAEPARRIRALAETCRGEAATVSALCQGTLDEARAAVAGQTALAAGVRDYLAKFGDRCLQELKLESATLDDDPLPLFRSIGHFARRLNEHPEAAQPRDETAVRRAAERLIAERLTGHPLRRALFGWVLGHARARVSQRENLRFERTRLFGRVRRIFVACGGRLAENGVLADPRDIFHLELAEILGFVEGSLTAPNLGGLVALRKAEFARYAAETSRVPSPRFETRGAVHVGHAFRAAATPGEISPGESERRGLGCCAGVVRGVARVILDPRGAEIRAGEILVASHTDPGWILLFPAAAGVVVEYGSLLSHSAIVARELGIPAVVSVSGLTAWLRTGDVIELDGSAGVVRRIKAVES